MLKSILISAVMMLLLAGLTNSQDKLIDGAYVSVNDEGIYNPPYNPDWMGTDIQVYNHSGTTNNVTNRTLDMEYCEENGYLYIAACINITGYHGLRVWSSSNSGLTWILETNYFSTTIYFTGLTMTVDQSYSYRPDSVRVNIFYTRTSSTNNDNASLHFYSFKPHASSTNIVAKTIATPPAGREFAFPSAYSNGQFNGTGTDMGCIVGEYNNAGTACYNLRKYYMLNWSWNFTGYTLGVLNSVYYPSAVYKNDQSTSYDSVYIAVERRISGQSQIDLLRTRAWGGGSWPTTAITTTAAGIYNRNPCFAIQDRRYPTRMVITYTQNPNSSTAYGRGRYSRSYNGGAAGTWVHGNLGGSYTTRFTWVSCDTTGTDQYCTFIWGDTDSLNVRRSTCAFGAGTYYYDRASNNLTGTAFPVCAVYNNSSGTHHRSVFAYWGTGPQDIYANAENLPTGITNTNEIASTYKLSQNFSESIQPNNNHKVQLTTEWTCEAYSI